MVSDTDPDDDLVQVWVRKSHLPRVYEYLARLMAGEDPPVPSLAIDENALLVDPEHGFWTEEEVLELALQLSGTSVQKIVGTIANGSPGWVTFTDLVEQTGETRQMVRSQLGTLTKYCREIKGRKSWPFTGQYRGSEQAYRMKPEVVEWWRDGNLIVAEFEEDQRG